MPATASPVDDYSSVTETWGLAASPEQLSMMYTRYRFAAELAAGGRILEVGSGAGMGLPYLRRHSPGSLGGDFTMPLLRESLRNATDSPVSRFDAHDLPFADASFDAVLLLEMVYYLRDLGRALEEARRVLRPGGHVLITVPNPDRPDFNPSPFTFEYPDARRLAELLSAHGFQPTVYGAFPIEEQPARDRALAPLRRLAVRFHLIPRSMRLKALLKRVLYGRGAVVGEVTDETGAFLPPVELPAAVRDPRYKVLYGVGAAPEAPRALEEPVA